jgi:hypothetical protein
MAYTLTVAVGLCVLAQAQVLKSPLYGDFL